MKKWLIFFYRKEENIALFLYSVWFHLAASYRTFWPFQFIIFFNFVVVNFWWSLTTIFITKAPRSFCNHNCTICSWTVLRQEEKYMDKRINKSIKCTEENNSLKWNWTWHIVRLEDQRHTKKILEWRSCNAIRNYLICRVDHLQDGLMIWRSKEDN